MIGGFVGIGHLFNKRSVLDLSSLSGICNKKLFFIVLLLGLGV